ncbi:MAG: TetR/AcrR family transcriptional regulator, partial [Nitrososphaerales archaeon]
SRPAGRSVPPQDKEVCMSHQQRADQTREHLLTAASHLFTRYGYDATGVAEICDDAGVSTGAFYHHFPSKQALFLALLQQWVGGPDAVFGAASRQGEPAPQPEVWQATVEPYRRFKEATWTLTKIQGNKRQNLLRRSSEDFPFSAMCWHSSKIVPG